MLQSADNELQLVLKWKETRLKDEIIASDVAEWRSDDVIF